jgi:hypothetical protein
VPYDLGRLTEQVTFMAILWIIWSYKYTELSAPVFQEGKYVVGVKWLGALGRVGCKLPKLAIQWWARNDTHQLAVAFDGDQVP